MMVRATIFIASTILGFVLWSTASAHHGWGGYKENIEFSVTIKELKLGNPHDRLIATDDEGQDWNLLVAIHK